LAIEYQCILIFGITCYHAFLAGDHVKFGLPMASSATMLLYGLEFIKDGYEFAGQYGMGLRQVRWALEYFRKCYVDKDRFYAQVSKNM